MRAGCRVADKTYKLFYCSVMDNEERRRLGDVLDKNERERGVYIYTSLFIV